MQQQVRGRFGRAKSGQKGVREKNQATPRAKEANTKRERERGRTTGVYKGWLFPASELIDSRTSLSLSLARFQSLSRARALYILSFSAGARSRCARARASGQIKVCRRAATPVEPLLPLLLLLARECTKKSPRARIGN